ncbi:pseudouridine synthase [Acidithiobacillus sulfuriphilus]|uniref:Pseudouridine synthase n=2 Tax=Acidithiobacillus sulfuriphilus TaxID=1867749 RepID=A0A3M8QZM4_9PROT|nr:pseudouridine synthase [Acidithiobacillus sulfuriphilus]RNF59900.1 rRNA pseudouridine synthase [Acidithiobacillus sulfuriphilus]
MKNNPKAPRRKETTRLHALERILSKRGLASRSEAAEWIAAGRVRVDGEVIRDPERRFPLTGIRLHIDDQDRGSAPRCCLMLHKARGYVTTHRDEHGRPTVYDLIPGEPWLIPVGRLDQASEGLLLFSNDTLWAQRLLDPASHVAKTYHVQVRPPLDAASREVLAAGPLLDGRPCLPMGVRELRCGGKTQWLEMVLREGRNRQIRRLLAARGVTVLRLLRVAIGGLSLGDLRAGQWRWLDAGEQTLVKDQAVFADPAATPPSGMSPGGGL